MRGSESKAIRQMGLRAANDAYRLSPYGLSIASDGILREVAERARIRAPEQGCTARAQRMEVTYAV